MPIPKQKTEAIEAVIKEYFPEVKIEKKGTYNSGACREIRFTTNCIVGSHMRALFNASTSFIIIPTRSIQVEIIFT